MWRCPVPVSAARRRQPRTAHSPHPNSPKSCAKFESPCRPHDVVALCLLNEADSLKGSPEKVRSWSNQSSSDEISHSSDVWSLGCVLSVAATWLVLGKQGVADYAELRSFHW